MGEPLPRPGGRRHQLALLRRLLSEPIPALESLSGDCRRICGLGWGPLRGAVVGDPALIAELHSLPTSSFRWGHKFNVLGFIVGDESMIVSDGEDHRRRRRAVTPGFARRRLDGWVPMILEEADAAADRALAAAAPGAIVDLYPILRRLALGVVVRALFGERMAARVEEIGERFERPQAYLESPAFRQAPHPFPFTRRARVRSDLAALDAIFDAEITYWRASTEDEPLNVLATLVRSGDLCDAEIRNQVTTLIGAGYDSTAASLSWFVWCATTSGWWDRVAGDEAVAEKVMRETLRLHPAGAFAPRETAVDVEVGGYRIPKGTLVMWSAHLAGRDPHAWPDPDGFDPDRSGEVGWVPFGGGARNCIGFALAQLEIVTAMARLAERLVLEPVAPVPPAPKGMIVNRPSGGVPMRVRPR